MEFHKIVTGLAYRLGEVETDGVVLSGAVRTSQRAGPVDHAAVDGLGLLRADLEILRAENGDTD
jgi:hypothetical protein